MNPRAVAPLPITSIPGPHDPAGWMRSTDYPTLVPCPLCLAPEGEPCRCRTESTSPHGKRKAPHIQRHRRFLETARRRPVLLEAVRAVPGTRLRAGTRARALLHGPDRAPAFCLLDLPQDGESVDTLSVDASVVVVGWAEEAPSEVSRTPQIAADEDMLTLARFLSTLSPLPDDVEEALSSLRKRIAA